MLLLLEWIFPASGQWLLTDAHIYKSYMHTHIFKNMAFSLTNCCYLLSVKCQFQYHFFRPHICLAYLFAFYTYLCNHDIIRKQSFYTLFSPLDSVKSLFLLHQEAPITFPDTSGKLSLLQPRQEHLSFEFLTKENWRPTIFQNQKYYLSLENSHIQWNFKTWMFQSSHRIPCWGD